MNTLLEEIKIIYFLHHKYLILIADSLSHL